MDIMAVQVMKLTGKVAKSQSTIWKELDKEVKNIYSHLDTRKQNII